MQKYNVLQNRSSFSFKEKDRRMRLLDLREGQEDEVLFPSLVISP
jgi:hypothetical protein